MKKLFTLLMSICLVMSGCAITDHSGAKTKKSIENKLETKKEKSIEITPMKMKAQTSKKKGKKEIVVTYKVKNLSTEKLGVVADDFFFLKDEETQFFAKGSLKNMNEVLEPNEEKLGRGYYLVDENIQKLDLYYLPVTSSEKIVWKNIQLPKIK
ncbi:hypothetical protein HB912_01295 [Listeria aquatica]|uniref:DUF4352 domain-containing protein n=1 Tax=Listeria aquatica TaxID=1494960 RepID=A0A841ZHS7_9LIST|nr:hypothetical protein [Listeria aquatica]MBC1520279.1 hypothetical protein [Listeria aquatica]